jgi:hypothetical protein
MTSEHDGICLILEENEWNAKFLSLFSFTEETASVVSTEVVDMIYLCNVVDSAVNIINPLQKYVPPPFTRCPFVYE